MILLENIFDSKTLYKIKFLIDFIDSNLEIDGWGFVGGIPRDFFLFQQKIKTNEIDIVFLSPVEKIYFLISDKFKTEIKEKYFHERFITSKIIFLNGMVLDLITARGEYYPSPASLPIVKPTQNIQEDLMRRDLTINAIMLKRKNKHPDIIFEIIDPCGGYRDIIHLRAKVLHPNSFIEDPTRIYRLLKYKVRFNLEIDPQTQKLLKQSLKYIDLLSINRVHNEIIRIINEKKFDKIIHEFLKLNFDPINVRHIEYDLNYNELVKNLKLLRKAILTFEVFFKNQRKKINLEYDRKKTIFSFLISQNFITNPKYSNLLSKDTYELSKIWKVVFDHAEKKQNQKIRSKELKKLCIDILLECKQLDAFIALLFLLYKNNSIHLKFIIKKIFKRLFINKIKINPVLVNSVAKYYYNQEISIENVKKLMKVVNKMYLLNKVRTLNQAIRLLKKLIKRILKTNIYKAE
ncbi:MAG: hypothetical protein RMJ51_05890 [Candidatus Calescibacterium sp.]|nr:hypothetical protein [Candidatus Calescibacterium sp.]MCX7972616.1 hypothetical protein [bacterium]MDW8195749.1 hypothetical protein [Candidatus Calescibacterium sp.]